MKPFRFRADSVLGLRRNEEDALREKLASAETDRRRADEARQTADRTLAAAASALGAAEAAGTVAGRLAWHRSWIARLRAEAGVRRQVAALSEATVARTVALVRDAVQRRRVLERLRDRAFRRHRLDSDREHLRDMDRLAGLRHFAQVAEHGGHPRDDEPDHHDSCDPDRRDRAHEVP